MKNALLEREKLARCELMPSTIRLLPFLLCAIRRERIFPFDLGCRLWMMEVGTRERERNRRSLLLDRLFRGIILIDGDWVARKKFNESNI